MLTDELDAIRPRRIQNLCFLETLKPLPILFRHQCHEALRQLLPVMNGFMKDDARVLGLMRRRLPQHLRIRLPIRKVDFNECRYGPECATHGHSGPFRVKGWLRRDPQTETPVRLLWTAERCRRVSGLGRREPRSFCREYRSPGPDACGPARHPKSSLRETRWPLPR